MAESKNPAPPASASASASAATGAPPTMQEYKKEQARLREMIEKQRQLSKRLALLEDTISQKEVAYLEGAPAGNIIAGYDSYIKGTSGAAAQRRKAGSTEQSRVFSRSSISYKPNAGQDATTPGSMGSTPASHAPTPLSTSFKDGGSSHPTPTSATATKSNKKKKNDDDSEPDLAQAGNKKRTAFGAGRK